MFIKYVKLLKPMVLIFLCGAYCDKTINLATLKGAEYVVINCLKEMFLMEHALKQNILFVFLMNCEILLIHHFLSLWACTGGICYRYTSRDAALMSQVRLMLRAQFYAFN